MGFGLERGRETIPDHGRGRGEQVRGREGVGQVSWERTVGRVCDQGSRGFGPVDEGSLSFRQRTTLMGGLDKNGVSGLG